MNITTNMFFELSLMFYFTYIWVIYLKSKIDPINSSSSKASIYLEIATELEGNWKDGKQIARKGTQVHLLRVKAW